MKLALLLVFAVLFTVSELNGISRQAYAKSSPFRRLPLPTPRLTLRAYAKSSPTRRLILGGGVVGLSTLLVTTKNSAFGFEMSGSDNACEFSDVGSGGMKICDLKGGSGPEPVDDDVVKCNYEIKLADTGKIVVNARNYLFQLGIGEVVPGWEKLILGDQGVEAMRVGGVRRGILPASMAYGSDKRGCLGDTCAIPSNSKLELTVELVGIKGVTKLSGGASATPFELT
ncbi:hypothetical protein AAMO2058_000760000 [Amorphochlora amoebiformis]|uniref:peptidylprolyl isomerase n=1 Tax=Amorphochlora amoebiformis TaxID=1561963 RepID=A0A7S0CPC4_9EUKA|mmetsp:Transcript_11241/g.17769  ORF Transcript_11241/g.17769 Transcript_11241/m.17769 type:complete len:228 (+) Transcript_11241:66-749(+)